MAPRSNASTTLRFLNHVGDAPTYLIPDTGQPTTQATLTGPSGKETTLDEVARYAGDKETDVGDRVGFDLPELTKPGVYTLTFADEPLSYEITVLDPDDDGFSAKATAWQNEGND